MTASALHACPLPPGALLSKYSAGGGYADCYTTVVPRAVSHAEFVETFYTGGVFKVERLLLKLFLSKPSTDAQARQLAMGELDRFAAWSVEARATDQILLRDIRGRTRSWLMVESAGDAANRATRLYFGSAVVPAVDRSTGKARMGLVFGALLGFHRLYSKVLLGSARARLGP